MLVCTKLVDVIRKILTALCLCFIFAAAALSIIQKLAGKMVQQVRPLPLTLTISKFRGLGPTQDLRGSVHDMERGCLNPSKAGQSGRQAKSRKLCSISENRREMGLGEVNNYLIEFGEC